MSTPKRIRSGRRAGWPSAQPGHDANREESIRKFIRRLGSPEHLRCLLRSRPDRLRTRKGSGRSLRDSMEGAKSPAQALHDADGSRQGAENDQDGDLVLHGRLFLEFSFEDLLAVGNVGPVPGGINEGIAIASLEARVFFSEAEGA